MDLEYCVGVLRKAGVQFREGLSDGELRAAEQRYGFRFPPGLAAFLSFALPVSHGFVDWRDGDPNAIRESMRWPFEGMCFDIENHVFWLEEWGPRPESDAEACTIARHAVDRAPVLIPVCGHRYMPDRPHEAGNPVLSVMQTDVIYYGRDLFHYLQNEFYYDFGRPGYELDGPVKHIDLWSQIVG